jgi:hypothetical protein
MSKGNMIAIVLSIIGLATNVSAQGITPSEIFKEVTTTYELLHTYKSAGIIVVDIDTGSTKMSIETSFSILLKKPNLYLISWTQKTMPMAGMTQDAAVWSDGTQPYLYMGIMKAYSKMGSDELALASATGISGGAAFTIPSLFFKGRPAPFSRLKDPKMEKTEQVGEEDCYVVSGASTVAKRETFWISKSKHLIVKYARSLERNDKEVVLPEMTDEQLDEAIKGNGQKVTEENRKSMREMMNRSIADLNSAKLKGSSAETHVKISSPELTKADFQFVLPTDAVMKDSLFNTALSGGK